MRFLKVTYVVYTVIQSVQQAYSLNIMSRYTSGGLVREVEGISEEGRREIAWMG